MNRGNRIPRGYRRLRPRPSLVWQGLLGAATFLLPVFAVLYYLTVPDGPWVAVFLTQLAAAGIVLLIAAAYSRLGIWVGPSGIAERGFFGRVTVIPVEKIDSIILVRTFHGGGADTVPQLFVSGFDGERIIRMRGQFWPEETIMLVSDILDIPLAERAETVSARELLALYPRLLYWFERHPVIARALFGTGILAVAVALYFAFGAV